VVVIGGALVLYAWRAPLLKSQAGFDALSREAFLLYNILALVLGGLIVFVGTLAPLVNDALGMQSISVGSGWFTSSFPYIALGLLALVAVGIHAAWKRGRVGDSRRRILIAAAAALVLGLAVVFGAYGLGKWQSLVGIVFGIWVIVSSLFDPVDRWRRKLSLPRAVVGMTIAHIGLGVCVIAVSAVESYTVERDVALRPGETLALGRYAYRFDSIAPVEGPNYDGVRAEMTILRDGRPLSTLHPELRNYWVQRSQMKEASIDARWNMDVFAALGEDMGEGRWGLRAQLRPLIGYVWLAAFLMALGGALAASDRRYRAKRLTAETPPVPGAATEAT
jgi:cytochrome c-type biogenesis protein CcmF